MTIDCPSGGGPGFFEVTFDVFSGVPKTVQNCQKLTKMTKMAEVAKIAKMSNGQNGPIVRGMAPNSPGGAQ
mgnify:CR=1 FL=1